MARLTISLGRCGFCDAPAARFSPLAGNSGRPARICRSCVSRFLRLTRDVPPIHDIPEEIASTSIVRPAQEVPAEPFEQVSIADVLHAFRKGINEQNPADDHDSHFNLALAFFEMGLLDEAIDEFEIASAEPTRGAECRGLIGLCQRGQGRNDRAIRSFSSAIKMPGISDTQKAAFFFELAVSLEETGERLKAVKMLQQVRALDPNFPRSLWMERDPCDFRSVREAFAGGGSRDAYVPSRDDSENGAVRDARALEVILRLDPANVRARVTLAGLCVKLGRTTDASHHYLIAAASYRRARSFLRAVASFQTVLRLGVAGLVGLAHEGLAEVCDEMGTREAEMHRREARESTAVPAVECCSFCASVLEFSRPPARSENAAICADCLVEARELFAWTPTS